MSERGIPTSAQIKAWTDDGWRAHGDGYERAANPYAPGSFAHNYWLLGWESYSLDDE